jgi:hypothetical protein
VDRPDEALGLAVVAERLRAALTRLARAASVTMRPSQTFSKSSSLETSRSRCSTRKASRANTCGSSGRSSTPGAQLGLGQVQLELAEPVLHGDEGRTVLAPPENLHETSMPSPSIAAPAADIQHGSVSGGAPPPHRPRKESPMKAGTNRATDASRGRRRLHPGAGLGRHQRRAHPLPEGRTPPRSSRACRSNLCQCPHWGTVLKGSINVRYADGREETVRAGDVYYWPPGHTVWVDEDYEASSSARADRWAWSSTT